MLKLNEVDMPRNGDQPPETEGADAAAEAAAEENKEELQKIRKRVQELLLQLQRETKATLSQEINLGFVSVSGLINLSFIISHVEILCRSS